MKSKPAAKSTSAPPPKSGRGASAAKAASVKKTTPAVKSKAPVAASVQEEDDEEVSLEEEDGDDYGSTEDDDIDEEEEEEDDDEDSHDDDDESDGFEQQSSSEDESLSEEEEEDSEEDIKDNLKMKSLEKQPRKWSSSASSSLVPVSSSITSENAAAENTTNEKRNLLLQQYMHIDDLSSDDEEDNHLKDNTIGRVPLHWYDAFDHIGYSIDGTKLVKRSVLGQGKDRIDMALEYYDAANGSGGETGERENALRHIYDLYNDREITLTNRELEIIRRIQSGTFAHPEFNDTPEYIDYFSSIKEEMPLSSRPTPKHSFLPSKWELMKVLKIAKAMKEGKYVSKYEKKKEEEKEEDEKENVFLLWNDLEDETLAESRRYAYHLPAPKLSLPGHAESYNPPEEYLLTQEEKEKYEEMDPEDRPYNFLPEKNSCLRHVKGYSNFIKERFERCLDLYLCPRKLKKRLNIDPETLIPKLPNPKELKPFPNSLVMQYLGHHGAVRCLTVSPDGQYLVSGDEEGNVKLWEVDSGYCRYTWKLSSGDSTETEKEKKSSPITSIQWNPDIMNQIIAVTCGKSLYLITTGTGDNDSLELTESHLENLVKKAATTINSSLTEVDGNDSDEDDVDDEEKEKKNGGGKKGGKDVSWKVCENNVKSLSKGVIIGPRLSFTLDNEITTVSWHHKGDYLVVLAPNAGKYAISIHQVRFCLFLSFSPVPVLMASPFLWVSLGFSCFFSFSLLFLFLCFSLFFSDILSGFHPFLCRSLKEVHNIHLIKHKELFLPFVFILFYHV
jgi:ribosome biogenesis protein ERB1